MDGKKIMCGHTLLYRAHKIVRHGHEIMIVLIPTTVLCYFDHGQFRKGVKWLLARDT